MTRKAEEGRLIPVRASRRGPGLTHLFFADDLLFFSEAKDDQLQCIREGLDLFCKSSGQKVNFAKSSMLCSSNVPVREAVRLSSLLGVPLTKSFGKYLGHHVLHKGRNGDAHRALVENVHSRLEGWKLK